MTETATAGTNPLAIDFCGRTLVSPIVLLSGCVGFGEEYTRVHGFSNRDVGAIVLQRRHAGPGGDGARSVDR
jgi:dihydroorotate dehydrogenase (NAD+) catalytic subunit